MTVFKTMLALVWSVAVHSIKTFFVESLIFECSPLIMGGNEHTTRFESYMTVDRAHGEGGGAEVWSECEELSAYGMNHAVLQEAKSRRLNVKIVKLY